MERERFPRPEQQPSDWDRCAGVGESFVKDKAKLQAALQYIDTVAPTWILEPTDVGIEQPIEQKELIDDLKYKLSRHPEGQELQRHLANNLTAIRHMQTQPDTDAFSVLHIKPSYDIDALYQKSYSLRTPLSIRERAALIDNCRSDREKIEHTSQPNTMINGLLRITGARALRCIVSEAGEARRLYKGALEGRAAYFVEKFTSCTRLHFDASGQKIATHHLERTFGVVSECTARHILNILSPEDREVLSSVGLRFPDASAPDYNPATLPNRARMIEVLRLYAAMNP